MLLNINILYTNVYFLKLIQFRDDCVDGRMQLTRSVHTIFS